MRRRILYLIFFGLWTLPLMAQGERLYVKPAQENLRKAPGGKILGELSAGTPIEVLERRGQWVKVRLTGWMWTESLEKDSTRVAGYQIRVSHILVKTETEAQALLERVKKGESFDALAREASLDPNSASKGGDLGFFGRNDFSQAMASFEEAAFRLRPNEVSGVVKTPMGYHLIKRTE